MSVAEGYVLSKFREVLINGERPTGSERIQIIKGLDVVDVESGDSFRIEPAVIEY